MQITEEKVRNDLEEIEPVINEYRTAGVKDKRLGFDLPFELFARLMKACFAPQAYGPRIEKYIREKLGAKKVSASENKGDAIINEEYSEIKVSILKKKSDKINAVQIRPHQNVKYDIVAVDLRDGKFDVYSFGLSHEQMEYELFDMKLGTSAHGTKEAVKDNDTKEYAIRFRPEDSVGKRWIEQYSSDVKDKL